MAGVSENGGGGYEVERRADNDFAFAKHARMRRPMVAMQRANSCRLLTLWLQNENDIRSRHHGQEPNGWTNLRCGFPGCFRGATFLVRRLRCRTGARVHARAAVLGVLCWRGLLCSRCRYSL